MPNLGKINPTRGGIILPPFTHKIGQKTMKGSAFLNSFQTKHNHTTGALKVSAHCSVPIRWNYKGKKIAFMEMIIHSAQEECYFYYIIPTEEPENMHGYEHCAEKYSKYLCSKSSILCLF